MATGKKAAAGKKSTSSGVSGSGTKSVDLNVAPGTKSGDNNVDGKKSVDKNEEKLKTLDINRMDASPKSTSYKQPITNKVTSVDVGGKGKSDNIIERQYLPS